MKSLSNNNEVNLILGQNIRNIRKNLQLTQEQFAEKLDLNPQFISQIETGKVGISIDNAINICNLANCSPITLFKDLVTSPNTIDNYELLNERDKLVINQLISFLLHA